MLTIFILMNFLNQIRLLKLDAVKLLALAAVMLLFVSGSLWLHGGGWLPGEADWFLIDHNDPDRSFVSKIISPHRHDVEHYMARDLGHLVEHIDARFIHACVMAGHPHFISISNYAFILAIVLMVAWASLKLGLDWWLTLLLSALFLSAPPIVMSGVYARSGHAAATALMVALVLFIYFNHEKRNVLTMVAVFVLALAMVWVDRQGMFAGCVLVPIVAATTRQWRIPLMVAAAVAVHFVHYLWTGPWLIRHFTDFGDVAIPSNPLAVSGGNHGFDFFYAVVNSIWVNGRNGITVTLSNTRFLFGSIPYALAFCLIVLAAWRSGALWWIVVAVVGSLAIMYSIIVSAASALMWPDILPMAYYYIIGTAAVWLVACHLINQPSCRLVAARVIVACLVVSNIMAVPAINHTYRSGHLSGFIQGGPFLREALRVTAGLPVGGSTNKYDTSASRQFTGWDKIMKNPLEHGGRLTAQEFVESSQYLQFVRSEKGLPFGPGGRQ